MKSKFLFAWLILLCTLCTVPGTAKAVGVVLSSKNTIITDVYKLGCTKITSTASTYGSTVATANTALINAWMDRVAASSRDAILLVPHGFVAINGTLGSGSAIISGYNGGLPIKGLPSGMSIVCGSGDNHTNTRYHCIRDTVNSRSAGFVWVGASDQPMTRITGHGNSISGDFYGYPYVSGDDYPAVTRARAAIEWVQVEGTWVAGHTKISGSFGGFDSVFRMEPDGDHNHCDHIDFERIYTRDSLRGIYCNNWQGLGHRIGVWHWYCPKTEQSVVFSYPRGGRFHADTVYLVGDCGTTLFELGSSTFNTAKNGASFIIDSLGVDRALMTATQNNNGYFQLVKQLQQTSLFVKIGGSIAHGGSADLTDTNWMNGASDEALVDLIDVTSAGTTHSVDLSNLEGIDYPTRRKFSKGTLYEETAEGTAYSLSASSAKIDLGTTDPTITLPNQGRYILGGTVRLYYSGATFASSRTVTCNIYRTNNTAAAVTGTSASCYTGIVTTATGSFYDLQLPRTEYTATIDGEILELRGLVSALPSAGGLTVLPGTQITAERIGMGE